MTPAATVMYEGVPACDREVLRLSRLFINALKYGGTWKRATPLPDQKGLLRGETVCPRCRAVPCAMPAVHRASGRNEREGAFVWNAHTGECIGRALRKIGDVPVPPYPQRASRSAAAGVVAVRFICLPPPATGRGRQRACPCIMNPCVSGLLVRGAVDCPRVVMGVLSAMVLALDVCAGRRRAILLDGLLRRGRAGEG